MTHLLDQAIERVRALSPAKQDDFARLLLQMTGDEQAAYLMTPEEELSFARAREQIARREFASDEDMRSIWAKYGL